MDRFLPTIHIRFSGHVGSIINTLSRGDWRLKSPETTESDFWSNYGWLVTTSLAMIACYAFNLSNAGACLMLAVMHSVYVGGWKTGMASAGLSTIFSAIFLSIPDQLFHYTGSDARSLAGIIVASFSAVFLLMHLRARERSGLNAHALRLRTEDIHAESESQFREMADDAPLLLWLADQNGKRYFFSKKWQQLLGNPFAEPHQHWKNLIHPDDANSVLHRYEHAVHSGEHFRLEYRVLGPKGEYWMEDVGAPRVTRDGEYSGYVGCCVDRTERKRVEGALHQLSGRLLELQDDERRRISRELHDTTAQNLAVLSMNLCAVKDAAKMLNQKSRETVAECLDLTEQCSQEIRTLSYLLHPPLLDELGLDAALRSYVTGYMRRTGLSIELKMDNAGRLPIDIETTLFRILQEALTNVHRHSGSPRAEIRIVRDPLEVKLQISDEGHGMPIEALELIQEGANVGVGIAGMRERARQLGGVVKVASSDRGTTITAMLPLKEQG